MSDYLYNQHSGIFEHMNPSLDSSFMLPSAVILEAVDYPMHANKRFILDAEHSTLLDDEDLIEAIITSANSYPFIGSVTTREEWDALPREEQIALQVGWVS